MDALKSNYSLAYKIPLLSVIAAILIAVPLRVYQYIKLINPETGFYDKKDITISILYTVLALGIALPIVFSYIHNKSMPIIDITKNSKPYSIVTFIMAFGALIDTFGLFGDFMNLVNNAPRYLVIQFADADKVIDAPMADALASAAKMMEQYDEDFRELAK